MQVINISTLTSHKRSLWKLPLAARTDQSETLHHNRSGLQPAVGIFSYNTIVFIWMRLIFLKSWLQPRNSESKEYFAALSHCLELPDR